MATVPQTAARPRRRIGCPGLDPQLDERRPRRRRCSASGALGDALGRRRTYVAGLVLLGLGSLGCAAGARTAPSSSAPGSLEGVGGAAVLACGLACSPTPSRSRPTAPAPPGSGGRASAWASPPAPSSPPALDVGTGWRETYVVVGAGRPGPGRCRACGWLPESAAEHAAPPRPAGRRSRSRRALTLLVSGLTEARSGLSAGARRCCSAARRSLLAAFVVVESRVAEPMLDLGLLRSPGFLAATLGALVRRARASSG